MRLMAMTSGLKFSYQTKGKAGSITEQPAEAGRFPDLLLPLLLGLGLFPQQLRPDLPQLRHVLRLRLERARRVGVQGHLHVGSAVGVNIEHSFEGMLQFTT